MQLTPPLLDALCALARLASYDAEPDAARGIVGVATTTLGCEHGGLTLLAGGGRFRSLAATDADVQKADDLQLGLEEGPCLSAAWEEETYAVPSVATDRRWPHWGPQAASLGLEAMLAVRLAVGDRELGALNLYAGTDRVFTEEDHAAARLLAPHAAAALLAARDREQLQAGLESRTLIGQAQGMIMARFGLGPEQAFSVLKRYSQGRNVKLREVAERVLSGQELTPTSPVTSPVTAPVTSRHIAVASP